MSDHDGTKLEQQILAAFFAGEERLIERMLCAWDPAWGEPILVRRQQQINLATGPDLYRIRSDIFGLAKRDNETDVRVLASDHVDANGAILPPIPDLGMLAIMNSWLNRLILSLPTMRHPSRSKVALLPSPTRTDAERCHDAG